MVFLLLIAFRIWHLAVIQHDKSIEEASRPQKKVVVEKAQRATILDRFDTPLAINKIQYNASLCYAPIRDVPRVVWERDEKGKKIKKFARKEYIADLSHLLAQELHLDATYIEDLIYAKAAILGNVPCQLAENISEESYFRLKMLESQWPGIVAQISARRDYPKGKIAGELIGYIGPISQEEYQSLMQKMQHLQEEGEVEQLQELEKKAYSITDLTGKMGVEAAFDSCLRGKSGKKIYLADTRGNFLRPLPGGEEPQPGKTLRLAISSELQEYAEKLLIEYEQEAPFDNAFQKQRRSLIPPHQPWIKGGAIVVMQPQTGEILALASHPRFDPNDFIKRNENVSYILEDEAALRAMWDYKMPLVRERFDPSTGTFFDEMLDLTWENYLQLILPKQSKVALQLEKFDKVQDAIHVQRLVEQLLALFEIIDPRKVFDAIYEEGQTGVEFTLPEKDYFAKRIPEVHGEISRLKRALDPYFGPLDLNYEKLLFVDLYRVAVDQASPLGNETLKTYRDLSGHFVPVEEALKHIVRELFHQSIFKEWREKHFKSFLASKRKEEKIAKRRYARPFTEYLDEQEKALFSDFWEEHKWRFFTLFLFGEGQAPISHQLSTWAQELEEGAYPALKWSAHYRALKEKLASFDRAHVPAILQTLRSFDDLNRPLLGRYGQLRGNLEKHLAAAFYPRYGYGIARSFAYRQATVIGSIFKLVPAYEALRQKYLMRLEEKKNIHDLNPLVIIDDKHQVHGKGWNVGFTSDGVAIPLFYRGGRLPRSEHAKVGRVDLLRALETSSNPYFAMLAGDVINDPEDLLHAANLLGYGEKTQIALPGEYAGILPKDVVYDRTGLYAMAIGQHSMVGTPLQTAVMLCAIANGGKILKPKIALEEATEVRWEVFMPKEIQKLLIEGMRRVVMGEKGTARFMKNSFPQSLCERFVGKTSTAEVIERYGLDGKNGRLKAKEIWFGGILYKEKELENPDVVIVVYLKQGVFGRLAAPLAFNMAQKWHRICMKEHVKLGEPYGKSE